MRLIVVIEVTINFTINELGGYGDQEGISHHTQFGDEVEQIEPSTLKRGGWRESERKGGERGREAGRGGQKRRRRGREEKERGREAERGGREGRKEGKEGEWRMEGEEEGRERREKERREEREKGRRKEGREGGTYRGHLDGLLTTMCGSCIRNVPVLTNVLGTLGNWTTEDSDELVGIQSDLDDVIQPGKEWGKWEGSHKDSDKSILNH